MSKNAKHQDNLPPGLTGRGAFSRRDASGSRPLVNADEYTEAPSDSTPLRLQLFPGSPLGDINILNILLTTGLGPPPPVALREQGRYPVLRLSSGDRDMPKIRPIPTIRYARAADAAAGGADVSALIAPPYDVLDASTKGQLLAQSPHNIVAVDLPHLPAKAVGPDETYVRAGETFRNWLASGVLVRESEAAMYVYQQTYEVLGRRYQRRGLIANVGVQPFGPGTATCGGIHPHEQTFASAKEDRLKLMVATGVQLSPIFGLYSDAQGAVAVLLDEVVSQGPPKMRGTTLFDGVLHEAWAIDAAKSRAFTHAMEPRDVFIADGHHRYNTALNYLAKLEQSGRPVPDTARYCMFVLVAMQDPGMIVLPTHRVLGGMNGFTFEAFVAASRGMLNVTPFDGTDPAALEAAVLARKPAEHAMGLVARGPEGKRLHLAIATTVAPDPLKATHPQQSEPWRSLDVAIVQHLIVERICQPTFNEGRDVMWKFPHELGELMSLLGEPNYQLGVIVRPTPLDSVRRVAEAGELMPQKSTFFYPKLATGMVINPLT